VRVVHEAVADGVRSRLTILPALFGRYCWPPRLVFVHAECPDLFDDVSGVQWVAKWLRARGWSAASIHGERGQRERQHVMRLFANGSLTVLAAKDVAARLRVISDYVPSRSADRPKPL
jgi:hypothetical protein